MTTTPKIAPLRRLRANLTEVGHMALSTVPGWLARRDAYRRFRRRISATPARFEPLPPAPMDTRGDWRNRKLASPVTDLVIDGFPGSGNSFVSNCVRAAIDRPANVESHFHHTVQLVRALAFGVPAVVVVRDPRGACASLKSKEPALADLLIVARWLHFHRFVARHRSRLDLVRFEDAIADVDVVRRTSDGVRALVARPLEADTSLRRASTVRTAFDGDRWPTRWLLERAQRRYESLFS